MYPVSPLFENYITQHGREFETKAIVGGVTYDKTAVIEFDIEESLIASEEFLLGTTIASRLDIAIRTTNTIVDDAKVEPFVRLNGSSGYTDWVPLGSYYIDSKSYQDGIWHLTCFDKLVESQKLYVSSLTYPATMAAVFADICDELDYTVDSSVDIDSLYMIPTAPVDTSMRDMLGYIAAAHAACVRMNKDNKIAFVKFNTGADPTAITASDYYKLTQTNPLRTYTGLILTTDNTLPTISSGYGAGPIHVFNPYMDQDKLYNVFTELDGLAYTPFEMDWKGRPDLEIGDPITVAKRDGTTFPSIVFYSKSSYKGGLKSTIKAPAYTTQKSDTAYGGSLKDYAIKIDKKVVAAGGGGVAVPFTTLTLEFLAADAGLTVTRDGTTETWTWLKDSQGRITHMTTPTGREYTAVFN